VVEYPVTHFEYAKKVLLGKHTIVEKHLQLLPKHRNWRHWPRATSLKLSVFQNRRWDSDLKTLQQVISDGVLGDIVEAEFHFDRYNPS
jgi:predicted dehydrogenase